MADSLLLGPPKKSERRVIEFLLILLRHFSLLTPIENRSERKNKHTKFFLSLCAPAPPCLVHKGRDHTQTQRDATARLEALAALRRDAGQAQEGRRDGEALADDGCSVFFSALSLSLFSTFFSSTAPPLLDSV